MMDRSSPARPGPRGLRHKLVQGLFELLVLGALLLHQLSMPLLTFDGGWNLRCGQWTVEHGRLMSEDELLSSSTSPLPDNLQDPADDLPERLGDLILHAHWLGQVSMYLVHRLLGDAGLVLWRTTLIALAMGCLWLCLGLLGVPRAYRLLAIAVVFVSSSSHFVARPRLWSYTLIAASQLLWSLWYVRRRERYALAALALLPLWAQLHAGVPYGAVLACLWLGGAGCEILLGGPLAASATRGRWRQLGPLVVYAVASVLIAATSLPGSAYEVVELFVVLRKLGSAASTEFQATSLSNVQYLSVAVVALAAAVIALWSRQLTFATVIAGGLVLGVMASRGVAFFVVTSTPLAFAVLNTGLLTTRAKGRARPRATAQDSEQGGRPGSKSTGQYAALVASLCLAGTLWVRYSDVKDRPLHWASVFPADIASFVRDYPPPGRPFNVMHEGGYLMWQVQDVTWFQDGRLLRPRLARLLGGLSRLTRTTDGRELAWKALFRHYDLHWALVPLVEVTDGDQATKLHSMFVVFLREPDWRLVKIDSRHALFVEATPDSEAYLAQHQMSLQSIQTLPWAFIGASGFQLQPDLELLAIAEILLFSGRLDELGPSALPQPRALLERVEPSNPYYKTVQSWLHHWPAFVLPYVERLARLPGGDAYRQKVEQLRAQAEGPRPGAEGR